jgi:hypothetical protein
MHEGRYAIVVCSYVDKALSMSTAIIEANGEVCRLPAAQRRTTERPREGAPFLESDVCGEFPCIMVDGQFPGVQCFVPLTKGVFGRDSHGTRGEQMIRLLRRNNVIGLQL